MDDMVRSSAPVRIVALLVAATLTGVALVACRVLATGALRYSFLVWNVFLAWIPVVAALVLHGQRGKAFGLAWSAPVAIVWLLFFPNAPYIATDLMHLRLVGAAPLWFDTMLLLWFATLGLVLGFVSLFLVHRRMDEAWGPLAGWAAVLVMSALSGFGIYLGRFGRWNSWDVLMRPTRLLWYTWDNLRHPFFYARTLSSSVVIALFFLFVYLILHALVHLKLDGPPKPDATLAK
jgi:uncharacterized membrane protein